MTMFSKTVYKTEKKIELHFKSMYFAKTVQTGMQLGKIQHNRNAVNN